MLPLLSPTTPLTCRRLRRSRRARGPGSGGTLDLSGLPHILAATAQTASWGDFDETTASSGSAVGAASGGPHRCTICRKGFATGQALGGHKRCHYWDGMSASVSMSASTSVSASGGTGSSGVTARNFDLNLTPLPENNYARIRRWAEEEEVQSPLPIKKRRMSE